ncbi:MAG: YbhN family protein [Acidimicrobiia bacterium]|nr:YbhN family protein [Acidimicrobiia bacterium]
MNIPTSDLFSGSSLGKRAIIMFIGMLSLYYFAPDILELINSAPELVKINRRWFFLMIFFEVISFTFLWWLTRIVLPNVTWFVASTSQLASNAASRVIPGGAAVGGAVLYRMLAVSGTSSGQAGAALAATSGLSTTALAAFPAAGVALAAAGAPIPESLVPAVLAGGVMFPVLVCVGVVSVRTTRPLLRLGIVVSKVVAWAGRIVRRPWQTDPRRLVRERDRMVAAIGDRWLLAVVAAALNWVFDYLVLVTALVAVGADPRLSLVLLAYTGGALLTMIPVTPGGFGFVETGMTYLLVLSGITKGDALLATLAYRIVSLWLPILAGSLAWLAFQRRYGSSAAAVPEASSPHRSAQEG